MYESRRAFWRDLVLHISETQGDSGPCTEAVQCPCDPALRARAGGGLRLRPVCSVRTTLDKVGGSVAGVTEVGR